MRLRHHTHRGSLLFTLLVGVVAVNLLAGPITAPIQSPSVVEADEPDPTARPSERIPFPAELHSQWYTQTLPPTLTTGEMADVTIQFRNVGHTEWIYGSPSELRLGEIGPRPLPPEMRLDWLAWDRPAAQSEPIVDERQIATFSFKVAGAAPGTYRLNLRPVVDGVAWLKDEGVHIDITVRE